MNHFTSTTQDEKHSDSKTECDTISGSFIERQLRWMSGAISAGCAGVLYSPFIFYQYVQARRLKVDKWRASLRAKQQWKDVLLHGRRIGSRYAEVVGAAAFGGLVTGLML